MVQEGPSVQAVGRLWPGPQDAGFAGVQNASIMGVMETSIQISKESLWDQAVCSRFKIPTSSTKTVICEAVKMKPKLEW
jgi:hypothetical protein